MIYLPLSFPGKKKGANREFKKDATKKKKKKKKKKKEKEEIKINREDKKTIPTTFIRSSVIYVSLGVRTAI